MMYERYRGPGLGYLMRAVGVDLTQPNAEDSESSPTGHSPLAKSTTSMRQTNLMYLYMLSFRRHVSGGACKASTGHRQCGHRPF
jgi:hypothetical protein